jgi:hypothetical protein
LKQTNITASTEEGFSKNVLRGVGGVDNGIDRLLSNISFQEGDVP